MKRYYLIAAIFCCFFGSLFSQTVSAKLAIEWQKEKHPFFGWKNYAVPYLTITYKNNTEYPVYFYSSNKCYKEFPYILAIPFRNRLLTIKEQAYLYQNYAQDTFLVHISQSENFNISDFRTDKEGSYFLTSNLYWIYTVISSQKKIKYGCELWFPNVRVTEEEITGIYHNYFTFLSPGDSCIRNYDLSGFQMTGGNFEFRLEKDSITNDVLIEPQWNKDRTCHIYPKAELPMKIGKYHLYNDKVETNAVKIKFEGIPTDEKTVNKLIEKQKKKK